MAGALFGLQQMLGGPVRRRRLFYMPSRLPKGFGLILQK
jgi:hypothetical protein